MVAVFRHCGLYSPIQFYPGKLVRILKSPARVVRKMWKKEINFKDCRLNHHTPEDFTRSFWQTSQKVETKWLVYRIVIAIYFVVTWIVGLFHIGREVEPEDAVKYPIFLTNWSYTLETWQFVLALFIVVDRLLKEKASDPKTEEPMTKMPVWYQLYWLLHSLLMSGSLCVTVIFWSAVFEPENDTVDVINISSHVFNSVFMLIDFSLVAHPFRLAHVYMPVVYAFIFMIFSIIYQFSGGTGTENRIPIYSILNWENPLGALKTCAIAQTVLIVNHIFFALLYKAKVAIKNKCIKNSSVKVEKEGIENYGMDMRIV